PTPVTGTDIAPQFNRACEGGDYHIHFSIVIEIGEGAAAMRPRDLKTLARLTRSVGKCAIAKVDKHAVGLPVLMPPKKVDIVGHWGVGGEQVLPAVIIQVHESIAPAAALRAE